MFYLRDSIVVKSGEQISGTFSLAPNQKNERDLDITIQYEFEGELSRSQSTLEYVMR